MSYATERERLGRQPVTVVEMDLDFCSHTYGVAPCTASVGVTGTQKCFNTRKTCQDSANYDPVAKTYRFSNLPLPLAQGSIASLVSMSQAPTKIDPGNGLGLRASVTVTFQDHPFSDTFGIDKYLADRSYAPLGQGTYWGKLIARNPYYQGRVLRIRTGYLTDTFDWANFESRSYVIERIEGPDASGRVKVTAKDVLKLADDKRAQCPLASTGKLSADITDVATTATLVPAGIGDEEYDGSGYLSISEEVCAFDRTADVLTLTRAQFNTTASEHKFGDAVQLAKVYEDERIDDVLYELLTDFAAVDPTWIDFPAWQLEVDRWLSSYLLTRVIVKPMGVNKLITELCQSCLFYAWWEQRTQLIEFRAIHPVFGDTITDIDETNNVIEDSVSVTEVPDDRVSQVWVIYNPFSPVADDDVNYKQTYITADLEKEGDDEYGESRIKKIMVDWFDESNVAEALVLGARILTRYKDNPQIVKITMDAKDALVWTGDLVYLTTKSIQNYDGSSPTQLMQVLEVNESEPGSKFTYTLTNSFFSGRYGFITIDAMTDYGSTSDALKEINGFIAPDSGVFADGTLAYKIV